VEVSLGLFSTDPLPESVSDIICLSHSSGLFNIELHRATVSDVVITASVVKMLLPLIPLSLAFDCALLATSALAFLLSVTPFVVVQIFETPITKRTLLFLFLLGIFCVTFYSRCLHGSIQRILPLLLFALNLLSSCSLL